MIKKILFPKEENQKYYKIHYQYILNLFKRCGIDIEYTIIPEINETAFKCFIDGKEIIFDFADKGKSTQSVHNQYKYIFVFHYYLEECLPWNNFYPFVPVSFHDWNVYNELSMFQKITGCEKITCRQRPYGDAIQRRQIVQSFLADEFNGKFDNNIINQYEFLKEAHNDIISICVPGHHNNMIDRGQLQYIALGGITISPRIPEIFPYQKKLISNEHYIRCSDGYEDLIDIIKYYQENDFNTLLQISENCKSFFSKYCTPINLIKYIDEVING